MTAVNPDIVINRYMRLTAELQARVIFLESALEASSPPWRTGPVAPSEAAAEEHTVT